MLGREGDTGTLALPYDIDLRSSSLLTVNSAVEITGDTVVNGGNYEINHDFVYDGVVSSLGAGFGKNGPATMTLNGDNIHTGNTTIRAGSMLVNGTHVGGANYNINGGLLGGSGIIDANVNLNSGTLAPGAESSAATRFTIDGNLVQASGTTLAINTYSDSSDGVDVEGTVNLAGTLDLSSADGSVMGAGDTFDIVTANSISGEFDTVLMPEDWSVDVIYSDTFVRLQVQLLLLGDANGNGEVNNRDITPFALALFNRSAYQLMYPTIDPDEVLDMNGDGVFNNRDIAGFAADLGF